MAETGYLKVETSAKAYDIIVEHLEELEIPNAEIKKKGRKTLIYDNYADYDEDFIAEVDLDNDHYENVVQKLFDILSEYTFSAFVSLVECGIEDGFFAKKENDYLIFSHYDEDFISYDNLEKLSEEDEISISNYSKCISVYQNGKKIKPKEYTDDMKKTANGLLEDQKEYVLEFY